MCVAGRYLSVPSPYLRKGHRLEHLVYGGAVGQVGVDVGPALLNEVNIAAAR